MISCKVLKDQYVENCIEASDLYDMLAVYYPNMTYNGDKYRYFYKDVEITSGEYDKYFPDANIETEEKIFQKCFLIDRESAEHLKAVSDEVVIYFNDFDLWFWCIEASDDLPIEKLYTEIKA